MAEDPTRMVESGSALPAWRPLETLHREVDRLFESFDRDFWREAQESERNIAVRTD
jgi:hypothetical protein